MQHDDIGDVITLPRSLFPYIYLDPEGMLNMIKYSPEICSAVSVYASTHEGASWLGNFVISKHNLILNF
jgi:hypothetical protein